MLGWPKAAESNPREQDFFRTERKEEKKKIEQTVCVRQTQTLDKSRVRGRGKWRK